jgi:phage tail-like protein
MYTKTTQNLYNKLPEIYRVADFKEGNDTLLRYLSALDEGGIATLQQDIANLYSIMSIEKAPSEMIPLIGNMLGFSYIRDLDDRTQRKIVENLAELYKRKGTKSVIHFIAREFTKGNVKIVEMENRMFRTWAKESKLVPPSERHITPRTFNGKKINENTFYLLSKEGKHSIGSVIILIESLTDLPLLNRLLLEFLPVSCKVYLQLMGVERFEETMVLDEGRKETVKEQIHDTDLAPIHVKEKDTLGMNIFDLETSPFSSESKHSQKEKVHRDTMMAIVEEENESTSIFTSYRDTSKTQSESTNPKYGIAYDSDEEVIDSTLDDCKSDSENNEDIKAMVLNENEGIDMSFEEVSNISSTLKSVEDDDLILPPESPTEEE